MWELRPENEINIIVGLFCSGPVAVAAVLGLFAVTMGLMT